MKSALVFFPEVNLLLGDFYVSILAYVHHSFVENPIIPLAIFIHDHKNREAHDKLTNILKVHPSIEKKCIIISDGKLSFKNSFHDAFPVMKHLRCHNHYANDLKKWLKQDFNKQYRSISKRSKRSKTISVNENKHDDENEDAKNEDNDNDNIR
ncbi:unnamed protein product [Didymodactylos carnosus]|uniref:MULE transposase domain-containing protein n=2 Tax=Didymodactylos carnosus TaxID=1234261 RepID=A0A814NXK9_9BILA|nr:unnamed protein product [Didymodactylos carnosus]CAF3862867.1 unnamed protein product [Didymodactylos carnosus]